MTNQTRTVFDPKPTARRFYRLYLDGKEQLAKTILFQETDSEDKRIAVVVEALRQSAWNYSFAGWIQGWHVHTKLADEIKTYKDGEGQDQLDRRGYREGGIYIVGDKVRLDGRLFAKITGFAGDRLIVEIEGGDRSTVVRHRVEHYT